MNPLLSRLAALRRRLRLVTTVRGSCWTLAVLLGSLAVACLFDILVHRGTGLELPGLIRGLLLTATLAATGLIGYRWLLRPLSERLNDLSLALRVEEQYPVLNDALASTVEFLQTSGTPDRSVSPTLKREAVQRAMRLMGGCDFNKAVNTRGLRLSMLSLLGAVILTLPLVFLFNAEAGTALVRVIDPFGDNPWERSHPNTVLKVQYPKQVAYGQKFVITGEVTGYIPEKKVAVLEFSGYLKTNLEVKFETADDGKTGKIYVDLPMAQQKQNFKFRVRVGDASQPSRNGWYDVTLRQPPKLVDLAGKMSPQIELFYPRYTDLPSPEMLPPGAGNIKAVEGTHVQLRGAVDRSIARAFIEYRPTTPRVTEGAALSFVGANDPLQALALWRGGREVWQPVEAVIAPSGHEFTFAFQPPVSGNYQLTIEDREGLTKTYEFKLELFPDPIPKVELEQPNTSRSLLPDAQITVQVDAKDELYGLRTVYLDVRRKDKNNPAVRELLLRLPLYDFEHAETALPAPLPRLHLRPREMKVARPWSLKGLVKEGDVLVVQAFADDFNNLQPFRQPGHSAEVVLTIVGRAALAANIDEEQAKLEQKILKLRDDQDKAIKKVEAAEKQWKATGKIRPEDAVEVAEAGQMQQQIQKEVGVEDKEGLRGEVAKLQQTLKENKLEKSGVGDRLKAIKTELDRLADGPLKKIENQLLQARQELENKANAKPPLPKEKNDLVKAHEQQKEVKRTLNELLGTLENWAGLNEFRAELRAILAEQQELQKETEKIEDQVRKLEALTPEAEVDVRKIAELQTRLASRTQKLIEKMERVSFELATKDVGTSKALDKAVEIAGEKKDPITGKKNPGYLTAEMEDTAKVQLLNPLKDAPKQKQPLNPRDNNKLDPRLNLAIANMTESSKTLELMIEALEEPRAAQLEGLIKNQNQEQGKVNELVERLEKLQKRNQEANKIADPKEKQAELNRIAEEQKRLQEDLQKKARELARLQAPEAAKQLDQAAKDLDKAGKKLGDGQNPEDLQNDAKKKIEDANKKLKEAQKKTEDELLRELQSKLVDRIQALKDRQDAALAESARVHKALLQNNAWTRALLMTLGEQYRDQRGLSKDTGSLKEKVKGAVVFDMVLDKAIKAMDGAVKTMEEREGKAAKRQRGNAQAPPLGKEELAEENRLDQLTQQQQRDASKRLERLLEVLKESLEMAKHENKDAGGGDGAEGGGGAKGRPVDGIPQLAQLKVLREEQQDVNRRTLEFAERKLDPARLTPAEREELRGLEQDQERIGELFLKMARTVNGEGANP